MMEFWPFLKKSEYGRLQKCIRYVHKFKKISHHFMRIHACKSTQLCQMKLAIVHLFNN